MPLESGFVHLAGWASNRAWWQEPQRPAAAGRSAGTRFTVPQAGQTICDDLVMTGASFDCMQLVNVEPAQHEVLEEMLALAGAHLAQEVFLEGHFPRCTQVPLADQLTLRGGICGWATKATPPSPKSARQTAFQVARAMGRSPRSRLSMFTAVAVTIDSIINPVATQGLDGTK